MKKQQLQNSILAILIAFSSLNLAIAQLNLPRGSQMAEVTQRIGITDITISYSRPSVNNREIWGNLVPYGLNDFNFGTSKAAPWRAGANENTIFETTHAIKVGGKELPAGKYGLHMVINEDNTAKVLLTNNHGAWGSYFFEPSDVVLEVDVTTSEIPHVEQLKFEFNEVGATSAIASLNWEKKQIPFTVEVPVTDIVLADIRSKMQNQPGFNRQPWEQAANFALNNDGDVDEALGWIDAAIEGQFFSQKNFTNLSFHKKDNGMPADWNFFATSHGKGENDGAGGDVKNAVWRKVLQKKCVVGDLESFVAVAKVKFPSFVIKGFKSDEISVAVSHLQDQYDKHSKKVPHTQKLHHVTIENNKVVRHLLTKVCSFHPKVTLNQNEREEKSGDDPRTNEAEIIIPIVGQFYKGLYKFLIQKVEKLRVFYQQCAQKMTSGNNSSSF